ncbi:MAG: TIGR04372 family glycosyltransferase [Lachnospiraceae bacterium]|nr:TIGR04372 family glycosyltransferase [Lachnospiraceae bacterium]
MYINRKDLLTIYGKIKNQGVVIYGAGDRCKIAVCLLREYGVEIKAIADRESGKLCEGIYACSKQDIYDLSDVDVCIVTVTGYIKGLLEELQNHFEFVVDMGILDALDMVFTKESDFYQILSYMVNSIGREDQFASLFRTAIENYETRERIALREYKEIRLYRLWSERIGEFLCRAERAMITSEKHRSEGILDVFILSNYQDVNKALVRIVARNLHIVMPEDLAYWIWFIRKKIESINMDYWDLYENRFSDAACVAIDSSVTARYLVFSDEEEKKGKEYCEKMGLSLPFVCITNRDSGYLRELAPDKDYSYHNFRDSKIESFKMAVEMLNNHGLQCIRTGYIRDDTADFCIDYANKYHDDFMDLYLAKKCLFYLGDLTGLMVIPEMMDKVLAYTNVTPLNDLWADMPQNREAYFILKKYYKKSEGRYLNLQEMLEADEFAMGEAEKYDEMGIEHISNTQEEICDLAREVYLRLTGRWTESKECIMLQNRYFQIYRDHMLKNGCRDDQLFLAKMGAGYIVQNKDILFGGL